MCWGQGGRGALSPICEMLVPGDMQVRKSGGPWEFKPTLKIWARNKLGDGD